MSENKQPVAWQRRCGCDECEGAEWEACTQQEYQAALDDPEMEVRALAEHADHAEPFELRLCEQYTTILQPGRQYLFTVDPNCAKCVSIAAGKAPADPWRDLAIQFDGHRMQAMALIRAVAAGEAGMQDCATFAAKSPVPAHQITAELASFKAREEAGRAGRQQDEREAVELQRILMDRHTDVRPPQAGLLGWAAAVLAHPAKLQFPTMLRKMWSGGEVQAWLDEQGPFYKLGPVPRGTMQVSRRLIEEALRDLPPTNLIARSFRRLLAADAPKANGDAHE